MCSVIAWSVLFCKGFRNADSQLSLISQSTEMPLLVFTLFEHSYIVGSVFAYA